jgi:hypothetical protein
LKRGVEEEALKKKKSHLHKKYRGKIPIQKRQKNTKNTQLGGIKKQQKCTTRR